MHARRYPRPWTFLCLAALAYSGLLQANVELERLIQPAEGKQSIGYITAISGDGAGGLYLADSRDGELLHFAGDEHKRIPVSGDKRPFSSSRVRGLVRLGHQRYAIANEGDGKVAIIDTAGKVLARFGEGGNDEGRLNAPIGLAWSENQRLYVADKYNNRISVFGPDGVYLRAIGNSEGAKLDSPEQVSVDRQERVYVFERIDAGTVSVFRHDGTLLKRFSGSDLRKLANNDDLRLSAITVDPATGLLYLGDSANGRVHFYDWEHTKLLGGFGTRGRQRGQFSDIAALELLSDGRLAVADNESKKVEIYRLPASPLPALTQQQLVTVSIGDAHAAECDRAYHGRNAGLWCLSEKSESARLLDSAGKAVLTLKDKLDEPVAAAFGPERIALIDDKRLKIFDASGTLLFASGDNRPQTTDAFGLSTASNSDNEGKLSAPSDVYLRGEKLYVSDKSNRRVQIHSRDGLYLDKIANPKNSPWLFEEPVAVAVDSKENIYVADRELKDIAVFDRSKRQLYRINGGPLDNEKFANIFDLEIDEDDNLYVLCATVRNPAAVHVYRGQELLLSFAARSSDSGALNNPVNLSIAPGNALRISVYDKEKKQLVGYNYLNRPPAPGGLSVSGGSKQTRLQWNAVSSRYVRGYRILFAASAQGPFTAVEEAADNHATLNNDSGTKRLYYRVAAISGHGGEGIASEVVQDLFQLGLHEYNTKQYNTALDAFKALLEQQPSHAETLKYLGLTQIALGQPELAKLQFELLAKHPGFEIEGSRLQVQALRVIGDDLGAKVVIDRMVASGAADLDTQLVCGELSLTLGDAIGAVQCLETALRFDPIHVQATLLLAEAYLKLGVIEQGNLYLTNAQKLDPENAQVWLRSGELQQQRGEHSQAVELLTKALSLAPDNLAAKRALALSYLALKQYDQVRNLALSLSGHSTTEGEGLYLLGIIALEEKKYGEALIALTKATRVAPRNAEAWLALADTYGNLNQTNMVRQPLAKAVEANPTSFEAALRLGQYDYETGRYADAAKTLTRASALRPDHYDSHYLLADAQYRLGEWREAFEQAREANRMAPDRAEPLALLGAISAKQGKNGAAINYLKQAQDKKPTDIDIQLQLGRLYVDNNMFDQAKVTLEKAALTDATRAEPHALLGALYLKRRLFDEAIKYLDKATSMNASDEYRLLLDTAYAEKNKSLDFKSNAPQLVLKDLQFKQVFSAAYKQYNNEPIGSIRIHNTSGIEYGNLKLSFDIKGYMDFPVTQDIPELKPNSTLELPLRAAFNNKILDIDEDTGVQAEVALKFVRDGRDDAITLTQPLTIYGKNAILWARSNMVGAFVTPKDDVLRDFVRQVINENRPNPGPLNGHLVTAMTLFDALSAHGIKYVTDPNSPYSKLASDQVDYVQFARETLKIKSGDCDDLTVLLSAGLENLGIETAVLDVPGHLLLMFNTGLPASEANQISLQQGLLAIHNNSVWVPLEATMITTSFAEAWTEGARKYHEYLASNKLKVIPLHAAWEEYLPVTLKPIERQFSLPEKARVSAQVEREYTLLLEKNLDRLIQPYRAMLNGSTGDEKALMQIAIIYARNGLYDKAFATFDQILQANPRSSAAYNNRGNVFFFRGEFDRALNDYSQAEQIDGNDAGIKINIAMTHYKLGQLDGAKQKYKAALALDDAMSARYADFGRMLAN